MHPASRVKEAHYKRAATRRRGACRRPRPYNTGPTSPSDSRAHEQPATSRISASARRVLEDRGRAPRGLAPRIDAVFRPRLQLMLDCHGRVVVTGMGKSGHIGGKIAATLASTGTPAFFVHPGEASHGDLGMITPKDLRDRHLQFRRNRARSSPSCRCSSGSACP